MRTAELVAAIDKNLHIEEFEDAQVNGLQVEGRDWVRKLTVAVSVNQETIDAAIENQSDGLLTHHGILWANTPGHIRGVHRHRLRTMLRNDLNLLTYHLPLDAHMSLGNNAGLAAAAGCHETTPAFPYKGKPIGVEGRLKQAQPAMEWAKAFEAKLRDGVSVATGPFQHWAFGPEEVRRIGFVSGAAPALLQQAIEDGVDVFVTGEVNEPTYHLAKEANIHVIAAGHYLSERLGVQRLAGWIEKRFGLQWEFVDVATEV